MTDTRRSTDPRILLTADDDGDEPVCNRSGNPLFAAIAAAIPASSRDVPGPHLSRRGLLAGGLATIVGTLLDLRLPDGSSRAHAGVPGLLGFESVPVSEADRVIVPRGYRVQVLAPFGQPIDGSLPPFSLAASGADQARQVGAHHDGMHFFPLDGSATDGLLVMNHEYVEPRFMHARYAGLDLGGSGVVVTDGVRDPDEVLKELNAHGVSILRIGRGADGHWAVRPDPRNRRITGLTRMALRGPVRGSPLVQTRYSPDGTATRGTLNNCAHGVTPWNTYIAAEENWAAYFTNRDRVGDKPSLPREQARYGVRTGPGRYRWEAAAGGADETIRFDASTRAAEATGDYRNEPNTFGWLVEIDPFDPDSTPVKRTALGRFAHEGVVFAPAIPGRPVVCYSGDDATFEYLYKFVSARPYDPATASGDLLDDGTLHAARFAADGTGEWLPLVHGRQGLTEADGFASQAEVLVNTRLAADAVGATRMDRPEWGAIDPASGEVYFTLTNNGRRTQAEVDGPNPRAQNPFGQIVRWRERGGHAGSRFDWDLFAIAGDKPTSRGPNGKALDDSTIFACPDGLWFDPDGRLWIQTDIGESQQNKGAMKPFGNNQMLVADPGTGEIRRFLVGPVGQEITGVITTPDQRTMFVNVQHPGATTPGADFAAGRLVSHWPDGGTAIPRSATLVITREDGGKIGA